MRGCSPRGCLALFVDIYRGAVLGDFARELGLAGIVTQIVFGFLPLIGTLCAVRDAWADWRYRDYVGFGLNVLAVFPILGGLPKVVDRLRSVRRVGSAVFVRNEPASAGE